MNCTLAATGNVPPWALAGLALVALLVGIPLVVRAGRRRRVSGPLLLLGCLWALLLVAAAPAAHAACARPANSLTIVQTSAITGLSPTRAPLPITGRVTNNGPDETHITAVTVTVVSVVTAAGALPGTCDATDYVILDPRMRVNVELAPHGGLVDFAGARISFLDKASNQDACKGARVGLLYVSE